MIFFHARMLNREFSVLIIHSIVIAGYLILAKHQAAAQESCTLPVPNDDQLKIEIGQMIISTVDGLHLDQPPKNRGFSENEFEAITKYNVGGWIVRKRENLVREIKETKPIGKSDMNYEIESISGHDILKRKEWLENIYCLQQLSLAKSKVPLLITMDVEPGVYIVGDSQSAFDIKSSLPLARRPKEGNCNASDPWTARQLTTMNLLCTKKYGEYLAEVLDKNGVYLNLAPNVGAPRTYFNESTLTKSLGESICYKGYAIRSDSCYEAAPRVQDFGFGDLPLSYDPTVYVKQRDFGQTAVFRWLFSEAFIQGLQKYGIWPVLKHFFGSYSEEAGSWRYRPAEEDGPLWNRSYKESTFPFFSEDSYQEKELFQDLKPFIQSNYKDVIMISHAISSVLNKLFQESENLPVMFSRKIITDYVKKSLGYELIVTDDMAIIEHFCVYQGDWKLGRDEEKNKKFGRMCQISKAVEQMIRKDSNNPRDLFWLDFYSLGDMVVKAAQAGVDMFVISNYAESYRRQENTWQAVTALFNAVKQNKLSYCRIHDAYNRIVDFKDKLGLRARYEDLFAQTKTNVNCREKLKTKKIPQELLN